MLGLLKGPWRHWRRDLRVTSTVAVAETIIDGRITVVASCGGQAVFLVTSPTDSAHRLLRESGFRYAPWLADNGRGKTISGWCYTRHPKRK